MSRGLTRAAPTSPDSSIGVASRASMPCCVPPTAQSMRVCWFGPTFWRRVVVGDIAFGLETGRREYIEAGTRALASCLDVSRGHTVQHLTSLHRTALTRTERRW